MKFIKKNHVSIVSQFSQADKPDYVDITKLNGEKEEKPRILIIRVKNYVLIYDYNTFKNHKYNDMLEFTDLDNNEKALHHMGIRAGAAAMDFDLFLKILKEDDASYHSESDVKSISERATTIEQKWTTLHEMCIALDELQDVV